MPMSIERRDDLFQEAWSRKLVLVASLLAANEVISKASGIALASRIACDELTGT